MKHLLRYAAAAAVVITFELSPAFSQANYQMFVCGKRDEVVEALSESSSENQLGFGVMEAPDGAVTIDVFAASNGTWTILYNYPNGTSCLLAHGTDWTPVEAPPPPAY